MPSGGASDLGPEISCEHLGAQRMRVRDLGVPQLVGTPNRTQTVHLPIGFFQTTVSTTNKPEFFSAGVAGLSCWGGGTGWIPVCPEGSAPSGYCRPRGRWPGSDMGLGGARPQPPAGGLGDSDAGPLTRHLQTGPGHGLPMQRPVTPPAALRGGCHCLLLGRDSNPSPATWACPSPPEHVSLYICVGDKNNLSGGRLCGLW